MNKFEQVSRDGLQMSLAGGWGGSLDLCLGVRPGLGRVPWPHVGGGLYSEVQCIMGNGHMGTPPWTDRHTHL